MIITTQQIVDALRASSTHEGMQRDNIDVCAGIGISFDRDRDHVACSINARQFASMIRDVCAMMTTRCDVRVAINNEGDNIDVNAYPK